MSNTNMLVFVRFVSLHSIYSSTSLCKTMGSLHIDFTSHVCQMPNAQHLLIMLFVVERENIYLEIRA